jgi:nucleotide-binding universal stress UspA family protein
MLSEQLHEPPARPCIVVGVDGSPGSARALQWAARLGPCLGARIEVVAAWQIPAVYGWALVDAVQVNRADTEKLVSDTVAGVFGVECPDALSVVVREGNPASVLINASKTALMTIVGSRGHGGVVGMLVGSVSASVMEHASCPVLVVHDLAPTEDASV